MLNARFRVYAPNGALTGPLPFPMTWELAVPLNDMPSLRLDYHPDSSGIDLLGGPAEVAVEFRDPVTGDYTEFPGCRFLNLRNRGDRLDRSGLMQFTMPSYGWQLRKARNINFALFDDDGKRSFLAATPGEIIAALINEAKTRGNIPQLAIDFSGAQDSDGQAWDNTITIALDAGQDVWSVLDAFTRQGLCDWRMNGRTLQVYNPDEFLNRNLTNDPAIVLRPYLDVTGEPNEATLEDLARKALVQGDNNTFVEVENVTALTPWGEWEEFISQAGVEDTGTMTVLAQRVLEGKAQERVQLTRQLVFRDGSPLPFINYRPGDHILSTDETGAQRTDVRVTQITISTMEEDGPLQGFVLLNDRFMERELRNQRAINSLTGLGGPGGTGGSGGTVTPPPTEDTRAPAAPQGLVVQSTTYINEFGNPVGQATATWSPVTESTGGSPMDVDRYEVQARLQTLPEGYETRTFVTHPQTTAFVSPLDVERTYVFRVRAVGANGRSGPFSATQMVLIERDQDPTEPPSLPVLSSRLGTIRATWDGLDENGQPMPLDFSHVQVEMADNGAGPWQEVGRIFSGGDSVIVTDLPYGGEFFFRFISVDTSVNLSDPSDVASIEVVRVEGPDIEANSITTNHIQAGSITAEKIQAYAITADRLAIGQARNLIADSNFADETLSDRRVDHAQGLPNSGSTITWSFTGSSMAAQLNSNLFASSTGRMGWVNNLLVDTNLASGETLPSIQLAAPIDQDFGRMIARVQVNISLASGSWTPGASVVVTTFSRFYDRDGNNITVSASIGANTFTEPTAGFITLQSVTGSVIPANAAAVIHYTAVQFVDHTDTNVIVQLASPFASQANQEVMIENGAISANKIQANAITTTQLAADAITAKHTITGAVFRTDLPGNLRVFISNNANFFNQPGVRLDSDGTGGRFSQYFIVGSAGHTGWEPFTALVMGPEPTLNGANRADLFLESGGRFMLHKEIQLPASGGIGRQYTQQTGIEGANTTNECRLWGTLPRGNEFNLGVGEMIRAISVGIANGSWTWSQTEIDNNNVIYRPNGQTRVSAANGAAGNPGYTSTYSISLSGFSWTSNGPVNRVDWFFYRGGLSQ